VKGILRRPQDSLNLARSQMDEPLNISEEELAGLRANSQPDGFLLDLVRLADRGVGLPIGLLANGMVVIGTVTPPETFAEHFDKCRQQVLQDVEKPEEMNDDDWAKAVESFASSSMRAVKRYRDNDDKLATDIKTHEAKGKDEEPLPGDLQLKVIARDTRPHLTLSDATIVAPGTAGKTEVPVLRVAISNVSAWWVPHINSAGDAQFSLFGLDDDG
jgi:hypothetical protein